MIPKIIKYLTGRPSQKTVPNTIVVKQEDEKYVNDGDEQILFLSQKDRLKIAESSYLFKDDGSSLAKTSPDKIKKFIRKFYPGEVKSSPEKKLQIYTNHLRYEAITKSLNQYGFYCYVFNILLYCAENPDKSLSKTVNHTLKLYLAEYFKISIANGIDLHHTNPDFPILEITKTYETEVSEIGKIKYNEIDGNLIDQQLEVIISDLKELAEQTLSGVKTTKTSPPTSQTQTAEEQKTPILDPDNTLLKSEAGEVASKELTIEDLDKTIERRKIIIEEIKAKKRGGLEEKFKKGSQPLYSTQKLPEEQKLQVEQEKQSTPEEQGGQELQKPRENSCDLNQEIAKLRVFINKHLNVSSIRNSVAEKLNDIQTINKKIPDEEPSKISWQQDIAQIISKMHGDLQKYHSVITQKKPINIKGESSFLRPTTSSLIRTELAKVESFVQESLKTIDNHLKRVSLTKITDLDKVPPNLLKALSAQRFSRSANEDIIRT